MCSNKPIALAVAALALANGAAPANAEVAYDQLPQIHVKYDDLNLASEQGVKTLQLRVQSAVTEVCNRPIANWKGKIKQRNCERKALEGAAPQLEMALRSTGQALAMKGNGKATNAQ